MRRDGELALTGRACRGRGRRDGERAAEAGGGACREAVEARRRADFNRALVQEGAGGVTASGLQLGGAETVANAVWLVVAEVGVDVVVGEYSR